MNMISICAYEQDDYASVLQLTGWITNPC